MSQSSIAFNLATTRPLPISRQAGTCRLIRPCSSKTSVAAATVGEQPGPFGWIFSGTTVIRLTTGNPAASWVAIRVTERPGRSDGRVKNPARPSTTGLVLHSAPAQTRTVAPGTPPTIRTPD
jgi:hypothetical protein